MALGDDAGTMVVEEAVTYQRKEVIGNATLYLGDCREVLPEIAYDSIVSDPPYGMAFQSNRRGVQHDKIANDQDDTLLRWACALDSAHSSYLFCRWDNLIAVPQPKSCITWIKNVHSMGDLEHEHARQTEIALFYPGRDHAWVGGRPSDVIRAPKSGNNFHPTEKPVQLMAAFVRWTAGTVLDPFMGSGSTGVACATEGRSFVGIELHEPYFEIACRRIEDCQRQGNLF